MRQRCRLVHFVPGQEQSHPSRDSHRAWTVEGCPNHLTRTFCLLCKSLPPVWAHLFPRHSQTMPPVHTPLRIVGQCRGPFLHHSLSLAPQTVVRTVVMGDCWHGAWKSKAKGEGKSRVQRAALALVVWTLAHSGVLRRGGQQAAPARRDSRRFCSRSDGWGPVEAARGQQSAGCGATRWLGRGSCVPGSEHSSLLGG